MRTRKLVVTGEFLVNFLKQDIPVTVQVFRDALPADSRLIRMEADVDCRHIYLVIESAAFGDDDPEILEPPHIRLVKDDEKG